MEDIGEQEGEEDGGEGGDGEGTISTGRQTKRKLDMFQKGAAGCNNNDDNGDDDGVGGSGSSSSSSSTVVIAPPPTTRVVRVRYKGAWWPGIHILHGSKGLRRAGLQGVMVARAAAEEKKHEERRLKKCSANASMDPLVWASGDKQLLFFFDGTIG